MDDLKKYVKNSTMICIEGAECLFKKKVSSFGTGAKINCPKEFIGKTVYVVVLE
ncbi:MAG: DUF2080 family transposase-associated protein [Candidatus Woesearchaeota archaeon]